MTAPARPEHDELGVLTRAVEVASLLAAVALLGVHGVRLASSPHLAAAAWWLLAAVPAGVLLADLASGVVHWVADTWGRETAPVVGRRFLRPFRVHHVNPGDFLRRNFIDTNGDVAMVTLPFLAAGFLIPPDGEFGVIAAAAFVAFCAAALPTNQVHQWAHMPHPPAAVRALQHAGLILGRTAHARHHAAPYAVNYCIAVGWCNRPLAAVRFFPALEWLVHRLTGFVPRCDDAAFAAGPRP